MTLLAFCGRNSRRAWAVVCLALFLTVQIFAASGPLHQVIHPDAHSPQHQCVFTLFAHGQLDAAGAFPPLMAFVAVLCFLLPTLPSAVRSSFDYRLSPSRAPPRF